MLGAMGSEATRPWEEAFRDSGPDVRRPGAEGMRSPGPAAAGMRQPAAGPPRPLRPARARFFTPGDGLLPSRFDAPPCPRSPIAPRRPRHRGPAGRRPGPPAVLAAPQPGARAWGATARMVVSRRIGRDRGTTCGGLIGPRADTGSAKAAGPLSRGPGGAPCAAGARGGPRGRRWRGRARPARAGPAGSWSTAASSPPRMRRIRSRAPGSNAGPRRCCAAQRSALDRVEGHQVRRPRRRRTGRSGRAPAPPLPGPAASSRRRPPAAADAAGPAGQGPQGAGQHPVQRGVGFALLGHLVDRLDQRHGVGQPVEVVAEGRVDGRSVSAWVTTSSSRPW